MNKTYFPYNTPVGHVTIAADGSAITNIAFGDVELEGERRATQLTNSCANQIQEYLAGRRQLFDVPLNPHGTDFQKKVWAQLQLIPYGQTRTYSQIAEAIGNPKSARAVGRANNQNPIPIVIPCHRVIGANGALVGYGGGLRIKEFLLNIERAPST